MKTFNFESRGVKYRNCYFDVGEYIDGKICLAIYGKVEHDNIVSHISNPTIDVEEELAENEVVIDNTINTNLISFLLERGIVKRIPKRIIVGSKILPVVELNLDVLDEYSFKEEGLRYAS